MILFFLLSPLSGFSQATWSSSGYTPTSTVTITSPVIVDQNVSITTGVYNINANVTDQSGGTAYGLSVSNPNGFNAAQSIFQVNSGVTTFEGASVFSNSTITIKSGATLIVGDLSIDHNTRLVIESGGTLIVNGNINDTNNGQGSFIVNGYVQVNGNYETTSGSVEITGNGTFQTTGTIITNGGSTVFGSTADCTSGPCSGRTLGCSFTNTISPTSQVVCQGETPSILTATTNATTPAYQWQSSTTSGGLGFANISGATSATYNPGTPTSSTWYRMIITSGNCSSTSASSGITVSAQPRPSITLASSAATVCTSASAQTTTLAYSGATNNPTTYSITWSANPTNTFAAVTNAALTSSPITITVPANTAAGTYSGFLTVSSNSGCSSSAYPFSITVNTTPSITLATSASSVCFNASQSQTSTLAYTATSGSPSTYSITWAASPANSFAPVTNASLTSSPLSITVPANTAAGTYTGTLTVANASGCTSSSRTFTITVNATPALTVDASATSVCFSTNQNRTSTLGYVVNAGSPTTYSISWSPTDANLAAVTNATLPSSPISIAVGKGTAARTYTGTLTTRNAAGCTSTNTFTMVVSPGAPTVTPSATAASVCFSTTARSTTLAYTATNTPQNYSIVWSSAATSAGFTNVSNNAITTSPLSVVVPGNAAAGTYAGTLTVSNACGSSTAASTNFSVTINPLPTITLGTVSPVCFSTSAQTTSLPYTATTGSPTTYSISWSAAAQSAGFAAVNNATLSASPITLNIPASAAANNYTGTITVRNGNSCTSTASNFTVTVNALPTITLGTVSPVCFSTSAQTTSLSYTATTGSPTTYSISWSAAAQSAGFAAVNNATLSGSPITLNIPASAAANNYTGTITVRNGNSCTSTASNFTVTVNALPTITLGTVTPVCFSTSAQTTSLSYSATTGTPTTYSISWSAAAQSAGFAAVNNATLSASPITLNIPASAAANNYTGTITVRNGNSCTSTASNFTVTVNALPTITLGTVSPVCFSTSAETTSLSYTATTGSPTTYSISWSAAAQSAGFAAVNNATLSSSPITLNIPASAAANNYTGTITVRNGNSCTSTASNFTVTVNALPTITLGTPSPVCFSTAVQTTSLPYTATTNAPTAYSISWSASAIAAGFANVSGASLAASPISVSVAANATSGTYNGTLTVTNANGCISVSQAIAIVVNPLPTITLGSVADVCTGATTTTLLYSSTTNTPISYDIEWGAPASNAGFVNVTAAALTASPLTLAVSASAVAGTYDGVLRVTNGNGCKSNDQAFSVTLIAKPTTSDAGADASLCATGSVSLAANIPTVGTGVWSIVSGPDNAISQIQNVNSPSSVFTPSASSGSYVLRWTIANSPCASSADDVVITVNPNPVVTTGNAFAICSGETTNISLTADVPSSFSWQVGVVSSAITGGASGTGSSLTQTLTNSGDAPASIEYLVTPVSNVGSCTGAQKSIVVTVNPSPRLTSTLTPAGICSGQTFSYTPVSPTTAAVFSWQRQPNTDISEAATSGNGSISEVLTNTAAAATTVTYVVRVSANACSNDFNVSVTVGANGSIVWLGTQDSNWDNAANWSCGLIPTQTHSVVIPSGSANDPAIGSVAYVNDLQIVSGASLTVANNAVVYIAGHLNNNGTLTTNKSTFEFNGAQSQTLNARGANFYQINVNKGGGSLSLGTGYDILLSHLLNIMTPTAVNTNGVLVLTSKNNTTADDASIGPIPAGASVNGDVTVQRMINKEGLINRYISAPVSGVKAVQLSDDFTVKSGSIRYYNEAATGARSNGYVNWPTTGTFEVGRGYLAYMYTDVDVLWDVKGPINKGNIPLKVSFTPSGDANEDGWNLVGNPYPSAVQWAESGWIRTNVETTIAVPDLSIRSGYPNYYHYATYNNADGVGDLPGGIIAMGQAFWIHANAASPGLTITEAAKTSSGAGQFYREARSTSQYLQLSISKGDWIDNAFLKTNPQAVEEYDRFDGMKFKNPQMNVFLIDRERKELSMYALNALDAREKYFIGVEVAEAGTYDLSIMNTENFEASTGLYFVDSHKGFAVPVSELQSYSFSTDGQLRIDNRFYLTRDTRDIAIFESELTVYPNPAHDKLTVKKYNGESFNAMLYDAQGHKVVSTIVTGLGEIDLRPLPDGVYILKIVTSKGVINRKVIKQ